MRSRHWPYEHLVSPHDCVYDTQKWLAHRLLPVSTLTRAMARGACERRRRAVKQAHDAARRAAYSADDRLWESRRNEATRRAARALRALVDPVAEFAIRRRAAEKQARWRERSGRARRINETTRRRQRRRLLSLSLTMTCSSLNLQRRRAPRQLRAAFPRGCRRKCAS